jgi:hypothetical protein
MASIRYEVWVAIRSLPRPFPAQASSYAGGKVKVKFPVRPEWLTVEELEDVPVAGSVVTEIPDDTKGVYIPLWYDSTFLTDGKEETEGVTMQLSTGVFLPTELAGELAAPLSADYFSELYPLIEAAIKAAGPTGSQAVGVLSGAKTSLDKATPPALKGKLPA